MSSQDSHSTDPYIVIYDGLARMHAIRGYPRNSLIAKRWVVGKPEVDDGEGIVLFGSWAMRTKPLLDILCAIRDEGWREVREDSTNHP